MIQRIQSVFLALAAVANLALFYAPFAASAGAVQENAIFADGLYTLQDSIGLVFFFALAGFLAIAALLLFRKRALQMRLTIFSTIALILGIAICIIYLLNNSAGLENVEVDDRFGAYLPIVALVLTLLAYRFINKDEKLVRSMDRLR